MCCSSYPGYSTAGDRGPWKAPYIIFSWVGSSICVNFTDWVTDWMTDIYLALYTFVWSCVLLYEHIWSCKLLNEPACSYVVFYGPIWSFMALVVLYALLWSFPWSSIVLFGPFLAGTILYGPALCCQTQPISIQFQFNWLGWVSFNSTPRESTGKVISIRLLAKLQM